MGSGLDPFKLTVKLCPEDLFYATFTDTDESQLYVCIRKYQRHLSGQLEFVCK